MLDRRIFCMLQHFIIHNRVFSCLFLQGNSSLLLLNSHNFADQNSVREVPPLSFAYERIGLSHKVSQQVMHKARNYVEISESQIPVSGCRIFTRFLAKRVGTLLTSLRPPPAGRNRIMPGRRAELPSNGTREDEPARSA